MMIHSKFKLIAFSCLSLLVAGACGKSAKVVPVKNLAKAEIIPSGYLLFQTNQSVAERSALKNTFLQTTPIVKPERTLDRYDINSVRGPSYQPKSPLVHTYHGVGALVPLAATFNEAFRWNIPQDIRDHIIKYNIDQLDIFFTPQEKVRAAAPGDATSLKCAYWMFPNRPALDQILGAPPEYQKTVLMGLFDSDHPIDGQVVTGQLTSFGVSLHDGRVSPDTGHINTALTPDESYAFYSLAIFEEQNRAAVTLHWMLTHDDKNAFVNLLQATQIPGTTNTFENLIQTLNDPASPFHETSLMRKLTNLSNPDFNL